MVELVVYPQKTPLSGTLTVPGDKSISHRAVMLAALADGVSYVKKWLPAGDTIATLEAFRRLGVSIDVEPLSAQAWNLAITGRGLAGLQAPDGPLDCRNAGTAMRLIAGMMAGQSFASVLDGSEQLRKRPMARITDPLRQMGAKIDSDDGRAPLHIQPARLRGISFTMKVASAQVKSALLLAGLYAGGSTQIYQPGPARDHTERMLQAMGAAVSTAGSWVTLAERPLSLQPLDLTVPGDISSAAFPLVAAAIVPHSQITLTNVGVNATRTGLLDNLAAMGASFELAEERLSGGEPVADLTVRFDELHGAQVGGTAVVRGIDEFPVWAVAASQAAGASTVRDATELRVKEVDRITMLAGELAKMGIPIDEHPDGFTVNGPVRPRGATVDSHGDHRLGMALAIAALVADGPTRIRDAGCIADSFPGFVETMTALGAEMVWQ